MENYGASGASVFFGHILVSLYFNSEGKVKYDSYLKTDVIVTSQLDIGLMDNTMAAEFCHSMCAAAKEFVD